MKGGNNMSRRFTDTAAAQEIINAIKNGEYSNSAVIIGLLHQIINDLPGTAVAREAELMLYDY